MSQHAAAPFDIDEFTLIPRLKLTALAFLLGQLDTADSGAPSPNVCAGIGYLLDDIRDALTETAYSASKKGGA